MHKVYPKFSDRNLVLKLDLFIPSVGIEARLSDYHTFLMSYQPGYIFNQHNNEPTKFYIVNQIRASIRYFYTVDKFIEKGKRTDKFAGNFFTVFAMIGNSTAVTPSFFIVGPAWRLQRNLGEKFQFSFEAGVGYTSAATATPLPLTAAVDLKLGLAL